MHSLIITAIVTTLLSCGLLFGCETKSSDRIIEELTKGLKNSNDAVSKSSKEVLYALEDRLMEPVTRERANVWHPKAIKVQLITKKIVSTLDSLYLLLSNKKYSRSDVVVKLFNELGKYRYEFVNIDSTLTSALAPDRMFETIAFDAKGTGSLQVFKRYCEEFSMPGLKGYILKLENDILLYENSATRFCYNKIPYPTTGHNFYSLIVTQSSTNLLPGDTLEIVGGVGAFSLHAKPEMEINGISTAMQESGIAALKFRVSMRPGRYEVPVKVSFTDEEGFNRIETKTLRYNVQPRGHEKEKL